MNILVTGAAGFIGSHLCEGLVRADCRVIGIDSFDDHYSPDLKRKNADQLKRAGVDVLEKDLVGGDLVDAMSGVDVVYHLAAQPGISSHVSFDKYVRNNILATNHLLQAILQKNDVYVVNVATSSIYGRVADGSEETSPQPISYYGVTKLSAEQAVLSCVRNKKFQGCSIRPFSVYGPRERPDKLLPKLIQSALSGEPFPLFAGSREHVRSFTYVGDIVDGLVSVLSSQEKCNGEIINLGTEETHTTSECIDLIEELLGTEIVIDKQPKRPGDQDFTKAHIEKAKKLLGYKPQTSLKEGIEREIEWYRESVWDRV